MKNPFSPLKQSVAIVGANGYAGVELAKILLAHPHVELNACFVREPEWQLSHELSQKKAKSVATLPLATVIGRAADFNTIFLATPPEVSLELAPQLLMKTKVIDLSGAFRLAGTAFETAYNEKQTTEQQDWALKAHYGLVPFATKTSASLTANPGCFATSCLMALIPPLRCHLIDESHIVIDAKSGTTGAGRKAKENLLFSEVDGECLPYKVGVHQHLPEIKKYADFFATAQTDIQFTTHLLPVRRGIISALYLKRHPDFTQESNENFASRMHGAFEEAYGTSALVRCATIESQPKLMSLKAVVGTPRTHITYTVKENKIFVFSCIDNLLKGAASQAIENLNLQNGWPAETALEQLEGIL